MQAHVLQDFIEVLAPCDGYGGGPNGVLEYKVPTNDPGDKLAHGRVRVSVCAACDGDHRGKLGVA